MRRALGADLAIIEAGALDHCSPEQIQDLAPDCPANSVVSRLRDGSEVTLDRKKLVPLIQDCITRLDGEVAAHLLLCTGAYPRFDAQRPVLDADQLLLACISAIQRRGRLGVMVPHPDQIASARERWRILDPEVLVQAASPYAQHLQLLGAAALFKRERVDLILMNCFGYSQEMKDTVTTMAGAAAILPSSLLIRIAAEIIG
jgi:protein AroM